MASGTSFIVLLILMISVGSVSANLTHNRGYEVGDYIPLFVNRLESVDDHCNQRPYFELPFCPPGNKITNRKKSRAEVLEGDCFTNTLYELRFKKIKIGEILCEKNLTKDEVAKFRDAVKHYFQIQMSYNNIHAWSFMGKVDETSYSRPKYYLVKHISFYVDYFKNQVKDIKVVENFDYALDITEDASFKVKFTYSVFWSLADLDKQGSPAEKQGKWILLYLFYFCIISLWGILLYAVIDIYLSSYLTRTSNRDMKKIMGKSGLTQIHGDECRCPPYTSLLGAILGNGVQQMILICILFILAYKGILYPCYRWILSAYLYLIYCLTSAVAGYTATSFHYGYTAFGWKECVFQTGILYLLPTFSTVTLVNVVSKLTLGYTSLSPFNITTVAILLMWKICTTALLILGGRIGKAFRLNRPPPTCTAIRIPRAVPQQTWYMSTPAQMFLGGLLPFMTIFWEMDNLYASLWSQKLCGAFGTMLKACIRVILVTTIVGVSFTYIQLRKHDLQWWWISFFRGASTAIFMMAYGIHYYALTVRNGWRLLLLMGLSACVFYAFFLALGTIGFFTSLLVFRCMYKGALKDE